MTVENDIFSARWVHVSNCHAIAMMFVSQSVCPSVCLSVWDGLALWSYGAL